MITRASIIQGPCLIEYNSVYLYSKGDVTVTLNGSFGPVVSESIGKIDERDDDVMAEIVFQPDGQITSDILALLFSMSTNASLYPGASVFPNSDTPLKIYSRDGYLHSFNNAAMTKEPGFSATPSKTFFNGSVTFTALRSSGVAWSSANSLVTVSTVSYPGDTSFNAATIITSRFALRWGTAATPTGTATATEASPAVFGDTADGLAVGDTVVMSGYTNPLLNGTFTVATTPTSGTFTLYQYGTTTAVNNTVGADSGTFSRGNWQDGFDTEGGFEVSTNVSLNKVSSDSLGVIDYRFGSVEVTATAIPIGPTPSQIIAAQAIQGGSAGRGQSRVSTGQHLYLSGTGIYAKLLTAYITGTTPIVGSASKKRLQKTTWKALASNGSGTQAAPLILSTTSIS